jgi:hypothetical protein
VNSGVEVGSSAIQGMGVFATGVFSKGSTILAIDDSRVVDEFHPLGPGEDARHYDYLEAGRVVLMRPPERHINHCCDPNSFVKTCHGKRFVLALRDIPAGEEITYDYCVNSGGDTVWTCHCTASRCRHQIHSDFFHLPIELQREYLPVLDDWFRRERAAEIERLESALG